MINTITCILGLGLSFYGLYVTSKGKLGDVNNSLKGVTISTVGFAILMYGPH